MRNPCFALSLVGSLGDSKRSFVSFQSFFKVELHKLLSFLNVNFNQLFSNKFHHFCSLLFVIKCAAIVKGIFQNLDSFISLLALVMALSESQEGD
jgi:hypothetical protein